MATALYAQLDGVDKSSLALGATVSLKTINQGHSTFLTTLDNDDQSLNGLYDSNDIAYIKMAGADILKGYIDDAVHIVNQNLSPWFHLLKVTGRDYSQDLSNLFISKVWPSTKKADEIIDEALARQTSEITYTAPGTGPTIGGYEPHQQYLLDICKEVLDRANWEAIVDTTKALDAFAIGTKSSGLTLTYSDLVTPLEYGEKAGLGIRNKIYGLGELLDSSPADEITETENLADWTTNGSKAAPSPGQEGDEFIRFYRTGLGGGGGGVYGIHDLDYALKETSGTFHFWVRAFAFEDPTTYDVDSAYLRLKERTGQYFQYDFTPSGIHNWSEKTLNIGRDHEGDFTISGNPDWAGINECHFYAYTADRPELYLDVDGIGEHNMNYGGLSRDDTSETAYRRRMALEYNNQWTSFAQVDDAKDSSLEKKKDPLEHIKLTIDGNSAISAGNYKLWPGYKVTLNFPKAGITSEVWRIETATLKCYPYLDVSGHGHDFTAELACVPETTKVDHLEYPTISYAQLLGHFLAKEAYKRRSNIVTLP